MAAALDAFGLERAELGAGVAGVRIEEGGFEERDAAESPGGIGELPGELGFAGSSGLVFVAELAAMLFVIGGIFRGKDWRAGGEAVSEGV